jgi:alkyl hydroperoxide reductase subunit AhpC
VGAAALVAIIRISSAALSSFKLPPWRESFASRDRVAGSLHAALVELRLGPRQIVGLSADPVDSHAKWAKDIEDTQGFAPNYPMIGDPDLKISKAYGMLPAAASADGPRTAADNQTVRNVFVIGPDKKVKLMLVYPMTTGRNFDEVLRVIDSLQMTAKHKVATPVNWRQGEDVIIAGSVSDEDAKKTYPQGWKAPKPYIRIVPQPQ